MSIFTHFKPISTALLPNAELDDIKFVLKMFLPWNWSKWRNGKEIGELENEFSKYFGVKQAISFSSGRTGLTAILSVIASSVAAGRGNLADGIVVKHGIASSLPLVASRNDNNGEIILQAYTTIALPLAIKKVGFMPVYVDIKENTFNIDSEKIKEKITKNTRAIIVQHTFGMPAEMDKITEICKKYNLFLIEDCAHSLGAEFGGKKIGTFGDAAFFSFGRDKIISSTSGGMVIVKNEKLAEKVRQLQSSLDFPPSKWIIQQLLHPLVFWCALPIYYFLNIGKLKIYFGQKFDMISRAYSQEEKKGVTVGIPLVKFPNVLVILALNQFKKIERFNEHRREIAEIYAKSFRDLDEKNEVILPEIALQSKPVFLYYTIQVGRRDELLSFAAKKHIILGDWFPGALGPKGVNEEKFGYKKGDCPIAERVGLRSFNLPTNIKTSEEDAEKVIEIVKEFLEKIMNNNNF